MAETRFIPETKLTVPSHLVSRVAWLGDDARRLPIHMMADSGVGKSRAGGRQICFYDFLRGAPQVVLDYAGGTISNFLDRFLCLPAEMQEAYLPRLCLTEPGASDWQNPMPYFYQLDEDEPLAVTAGRYLEVIRRTDPYLATASVEGWNALYETGIAAGILVAGVDGQITDMLDLVQRPEAWLKRNEGALPDVFGIQPALAHLRFFSKLPADRQRRLSGTLLTKLMPYAVHPQLTALVAGRNPCITMARVENENLTWLIDGRSLPAALKQELLLWIFRLGTDYINWRGIAGRERPIHYYIDEVTPILGFSSIQNEALAEDLEQLISVDARNYGCVLTICHQSLMQINSERIRSALMSMGTQIIGRISSPDDRRYLAEKFLNYDPLKSKQRLPVYFNMAEPEILSNGLRSQVFARPNPVVLDYRNETYSIDEQVQLLADRFRNLDRFCFLVRPPAAEGAAFQEMYEVTIEPVDRGRYPNEETIADLRRQLREKDGRSVAQLLAEIESRRQETLTIGFARTDSENGILEGDSVHAHPLPTAKRKSRRNRQKSQATPRREDTGEISAGEKNTWQSALWSSPEAD